VAHVAVEDQREDTVEPITPTFAATPIADRIRRVERADDGSVSELEFTDDRGARARVAVVNGGLVCSGRATLWPTYDSELEFGFVYTERTEASEDQALLAACARTPRGIEALYIAARTHVEAVVMHEAKERFESDLAGVFERLLPPDGRPGGGSVTETVEDLDRWLGDKLTPFERSAAFGRAAANAARSAWLALMIEALHEEQAIRMREAEAVERGEPHPRTLH